MIYSLFSSLPFLVSLFWLSLFTIEYRKANPAKRFLTFFMLACTLLYFSHSVYFHRNILLYSLIESIYAFCSLAVYPLFYLYICKLTSEERFTLKNYWVLIPALSVSLLSVTFYSMMNGGVRLSFIETHFFNLTATGESLSFAETGQVLRIKLMKVIFFLQLIPVSFYSFRKLRHFREKIENYYSDTEERTLAPVKTILGLFLLFALFSAAANQLGRDFFIREPWLVIFPSIIFSCMIFAVSYIGFIQKFTAQDLYKETQTANKKETYNPGSSKEIIRKRIIKLMEDEKIFRQKDLHISDLALKAGSNRTYVSNYINNELEMSFTDYINSYRIKHAQTLMMKSENKLSLSEVCDMSGFTNEVSFYRNFKKITGTTPGRWLDQA
jgi:AraC-like DNA-binding protein